MKTWMIVGIVAIALCFITILGAVGMYFSISNQEIGLRNQAKAQQDANKVIYDKVWKTIQQKAQISDQYESAFKDIYLKIMDARYSDNKNLLFKFVTEQNPTLSTELYKELGDAVEANRAEFARVQERLIDIKREHDNLRMKFPGSLIVGSRPEIVVILVTSDKTDKAFATGKDNDVELFKK
jgi:hypothetical protein